MKNINQQLLKLVFDYLQYRNALSFGYCRYPIFKNLIVFITGLTNNYKKVRFIFDKLQEYNYFKIKKFDKTLLYIWNPYNYIIEKRNRFLIKFE